MQAARWILVPLLLSGCAVKGAPVSAHGRPVTIQSGNQRTQGELIAVTGDTIWILQRDSLRAEVFARGQQVLVQRHDFGMRRTLRWMGITGLATGISLMIACNSYESSGDGGGDDASCLAVLPGTLLVFGVAGLLFGAGNQYSSNHRFTASDTARLRSFSRYPQGLPDSVRALRLQLLPVTRRDSLRSPP